MTNDGHKQEQLFPTDVASLFSFSTVNCFLSATNVTRVTLFSPSLSRVVRQCALAPFKRNNPLPERRNEIAIKGPTLSGVSRERRLAGKTPAPEERNVAWLIPIRQGILLVSSYLDYRIP